MHKYTHIKTDTHTHKHTHMHIYTQLSLLHPHPSIHLSSTCLASSIIFASISRKGCNDVSEMLQETQGFTRTRCLSCILFHSHFLFKCIFLIEVVMDDLINKFFNFLPPLPLFLPWCWFLLFVCCFCLVFAAGLWQWHSVEAACHTFNKQVYLPHVLLRPLAICRFSLPPCQSSSVQPCGVPHGSGLQLHTPEHSAPPEK